MAEAFKDVSEMLEFELGLKEKNELIYYLWKIQMNLALRVSDVISITIDEAEKIVERKKYFRKDQKTNKDNDKELVGEEIYFEEALKIRRKIKITKFNKFLFVSQSPKNKKIRTPITRQSVFRIYKDVSAHYTPTVRMGTHTARKTWGRFAYQRGEHLVTIMRYLNHSNPETTIKYCEIFKEDQKNRILY